ncbi:hypothetical protein Tco_1515954 [Tanacetum coccineum]
MGKTYGKQFKPALEAKKESKEKAEKTNYEAAYENFNLDNEDLEQIDTDDLEEMDLKWRRGTLLEECRAPRSQRGIGNRDPSKKDIVPWRLCKCLGCSRGISFVNEIGRGIYQVNDRFNKVEGYHVVPPPYIENYMPSKPDLSFDGLNDFVYKTNEFDSDDDCVTRPSIEHNKPSYAKINFVKSDENTRKSIIEQNTYRQAENLRKSQSPRIDKRNWNGLMAQK